MRDAASSGPPRPLAGLDEIKPYVPGDSSIAGHDDGVVKLSSNENALGVSPAARAAYLEVGDTLNLYPDDGAVALTRAIGALHGVEPERVICGAGSDELLQILGRAYVGPGDEVLYTENAFMVYRLIAKQRQAIGVAAPETNLTTDVDALLERVSPRTRIVFLANPNNPTGTMIPASEVRRLHEGLPESTLLVLDAAYAEFVDRDDYESGLELARTASNVVTTRTFSKVYGMAALRLGWMYGPAAVIDVAHRLRSPFNVSAPAIAAGVAALGDQAFVRSSVAHALTERARLEAAAERLGILAVCGVGNFVLLRFSNDVGKTSADADAHLRAQGLILRGMKGYGLPDCLRATIGRVEDNDRLIAALDAFMESA